MTVAELMTYFDVKTFNALGEKLGVCKATITNWNANGIPIEKQALLEISTSSKLKANREKITIYD